jgi:hypothetical protein
MESKNIRWVGHVVSERDFLAVYLTTLSKVRQSCSATDFISLPHTIYRSQAGARDFSSNLCVQTGSGAHPASCTMGTGGPFPGGKAWPGRDADHSPPSRAEVENE